MSLTECLFKPRKLTKINSVRRQIVPEIYDTFSKKVRSNRAITEVLEDLIWVTSRGAGS